MACPFNTVKIGLRTGAYNSQTEIAIPLEISAFKSLLRNSKHFARSILQGNARNLKKRDQSHDQRVTIAATIE